MNTAFGWAVVGTGRIANTVMSEIVKSNRHRVVAVYSRTMSKAAAFAKKFDAQAMDSLELALNCKGVEGVYIATPHSVHYQYILRCLEPGVPVLCEKAFTVNAKQAARVVAFAKEKNVYLCEGMWSRFNPVIRQICEWVQNGEIGDIKSISANFSLPLKIAKPFVSDRVYLPQYAGGALLDLGVYPIAYAHMLLGVPDSIECKSRLENGVDFHDEITLRYPSAICNLHCSFDKLESYTSKIVGTKGTISSPMFYKPNSAVLKNDMGTKHAKCKKGYIYQFDAVAKDIREGKKQSSLMPLEHTVQIMKIMDECRSQNGFAYPSDIERL